MNVRAQGLVLQLLVAGMAMDVVAEEGPFVQVPVDAPRAPVPDLVLRTLPPVTDTSAEAMASALVTVVREFCIAGVDNAATDAHAAARMGAVPVPDPWQGQRFIWATPRTTWSLPDTPRLFFWLGASELEGARECDVLAFEGDRGALARAALEVIERYAEVNGFGAPEFDAWPLAQLGQRGYIDRVWSVRDFSASIAEDRGDPALIGLHVSVHARPVQGSVESVREVEAGSGPDHP